MQQAIPSPVVMMVGGTGRGVITGGDEWACLGDCRSFEMSSDECFSERYLVSGNGLGKR